MFTASPQLHRASANLPARPSCVFLANAMMKVACKALTGKQNPVEEACQALSGKQSADDEDIYLPLVTGGGGAVDGGAWVKYLGQDPLAVPAEPVTGFSGGKASFEAVAMPAPVVMDIAVPTNNWEPGQVFMAQGPSGPIRVHLPAEAQPGSTARVRLAPRPEYRIQVPVGATAGYQVRFKNLSGEEVAVSVPPGLQAGDTFDVTPPALMIRVPEKASPGDLVIFSHTFQSAKGGAGGKTEFFRACIPENVQACDHFAAVLPPPTMQN